MPRSAPSGAGAVGPPPHLASPWRTRVKWSGRGLQRSFQRWTGAPTVVPKVCYGIPVPPLHFTSVPDPSAHAPRLGCHRLRGRPRRPGRRAGGRDEKPVSAGLRAVGAVVPDVAAAAPAPVWLPPRRSRRRPPIRPPLAPVLPRPQFSRRRGSRSTGQDPAPNSSRDPPGDQFHMVPPYPGASDEYRARSSGALHDGV